ncbi:hypothetical protein sphantq_00649 [Sphingobium sp. AntQ-1]|nr:hypothetical protein sphantq_00649 [Sphingobium sp. AntQ-1]
MVCAIDEHRPCQIVSRQQGKAQNGKDPHRKLLECGNDTGVKEP